MSDFHIEAWVDEIKLFSEKVTFVKERETIHIPERRSDQQ